MSNEPQNQEFPSSNNTDSETDFGSTGPAVGTLPPPPQAPPAGRPYKRNRAAIFFGVAAAVFLSALVALVGVLVIGIAAVAAVASGDVDFDTDAVDVEFTPATMSELPAMIVEEKGAIEIDLTQIEAAEWNTDEPIELDVQADYGSITVIVPQDVDVSVDASVDLGEVEVFDDTSNGFGNSVVTSAGSDVNLELDLDVDFGKIEVVRG